MKFSNLGMGRTQIENIHAAVEYSFHACLEGELLAVQIQLLICHADSETQIDTVREILLRRMFRCKKDNIMKQLRTSLAQLHALTCCYCCCHIVVYVCGLFNNVAVAVTT